jgi:hypothetical protein
MIALVLRFRPIPIIFRDRASSMFVPDALDDSRMIFQASLYISLSGVITNEENSNGVNSS